MSRRRISVKELGKLDCQGWLYRKKEARGFLVSKWKKYWFVLKNTSLYWYTEPTADKAEGYINLTDFTIEQTSECKRKHAIKASNPHVTALYFAAESIKDKNKWLRSFGLVSRKNGQSDSNSGAQPEEEFYSEETDNEEVTDLPDLEQMVLDDDDYISPANSAETPSEATHSAPVPTVSVTPQSCIPSTAEFPQSWLHKVSQVSQKAAESSKYFTGQPQQAITNTDPDRDPQHCSLSHVPAVVLQSTNCSQLTSSAAACGDDPVEALPDEMERLYNNLKQSSLYPTGAHKPSTERDFKASFIKRCKNESINDKLHLIRTLRSTLKAKESDLMIIEHLLADPCLTSEQYRKWKDANILLLQEICLHVRPLEGSDTQTAPSGKLGSPFNS